VDGEERIDPVAQDGQDDAGEDGSDQESRFALAEQLRSGYRTSRRRRTVAAFFAFLLLIGVVGGFAAYRVERERGPERPTAATRDYGYRISAEDLVDVRGSSQGVPGVEPVSVQIWDDFGCSRCLGFHRQVKRYLEVQAKRGHVELTYYPYLDDSDLSTDRYAERAANAAACAVDSGGIKAYLTMHDVLLRRQPSFVGPGLTDNRLVAIARKSGAEDIDDCVAEERFLPWLKSGLAKARVDGVLEAPTIKVGGRTIVSPGENGQTALPDLKELKFVINVSRRS